MATVQTAHLCTRDGFTLDGDLAIPGGERDLTGAVVLCHPHPRYGGDRFNPVVSALFDALPPAGFATLRFDFRRQFGGGTAERLDVVAALDRLDALDALDGLPRFVVGYSFGAAVALGTSDERIRAIGAVAPPLAMMPAPQPSIPVRVLTPRHDQFSPPEVTEPIVDTWPTATFDVVESADHFLAGHTEDVADRVVAWLTSSTRPPEVHVVSDTT
jgi:alpha/beta superfamily hydrolase